MTQSFVKVNLTSVGQLEISEFDTTSTAQFKVEINYSQARKSAILDQVLFSIKRPTSVAFYRCKISCHGILFRALGPGLITSVLRVSDKWLEMYVSDQIGGLLPRKVLHGEQ